MKYYGAWIQIIVQILYVSTVLYGPALSLEVATGVPTELSLVVTCLIGMSYTAVGGKISYISGRDMEGLGVVTP